MSKFYKNLFRPLLFRFPTETVHELGVNALKIGLGSEFAQKVLLNRFSCSKDLAVERFGLKFANPLGMAAGFDKNGVVVNQLASIGFGFVEVGTVTYEPQSGNEKPRLFRLPKDRALINRLGFNNQGAPNVIERLKKLNPKCILGVNIGKNKDVANDEAIDNYLKSYEFAHEVADYIAVNVSSPNTPNLRELQKAERLEDLLAELQKSNIKLSDNKPKPLLVKIAPDLNESEIEAIVDVALRLKISGIIATNTTIDRSGLKTDAKAVENFGNGGLSGKPVLTRSNEVIKTIYKHSRKKNANYWRRRCI